MSRKIDFQKVKLRDICEIFKTCLLSANDDFDDKSTYIYCFLHENNFWTKISKNGHCVLKTKGVKTRSKYVGSYLIIYIELLILVVLELLK